MTDARQPDDADSTAPAGGDGDTTEKADFGHIYNQPDPRAYYRELEGLGYEIPQHGSAQFTGLLQALGLDRPPTVVDLCCSYGVNGALLKYDIGMEELYAHYTSEEASRLTTEEVAERDRAWFAERARSDAPAVVGMDCADRAVTYAEQVGLLDAGVVGDAEHTPLATADRQRVATADVVTATGGVGYITERTIGAVVDAATDDTPPWVAVMCLRTVDYRPVAEALADRGLVTEVVTGTTFRQRSFFDPHEADYARAELAKRGRDLVEPDAYHAELFVSRPVGTVEAQPLADLLGHDVEAVSAPRRPA